MSMSIEKRIVLVVFFKCFLLSSKLSFFQLKYQFVKYCAEIVTLL